MTADQAIDDLNAMQLAELKDRVLRGKQPSVGDGGERRVGQSIGGATLYQIDAGMGGATFRR